MRLALPFLLTTLCGVTTAQEATLHQVTKSVTRPAGAPEYADVCFRYGWIRKSAFPTVEDAQKAIRGFHATRVDWFYTGSHTMQEGATYVTPEAKAFIDWCHSKDMKICGTINNNTTHEAWAYRKHHLTRFVGEVKNPAFREMVVAWGKAQIDAGVDTLVCDDIFKYDKERQALWSDQVLAVIKAHQPGFTLAGNSGHSISTEYVMRFATDYHYSDNNFIPTPRQWWKASRAHRGQGSAFLIQPNRSRTKEQLRSMLALGYAAGAHMIAPWDAYIHGGKRLFSEPADYADLYGFARALGQRGFLNGYEDAAVGGFDLQEDRYGNTPPLAVTGGSGKLSVFARARPGEPADPVVLHLVESGAPQSATLRLRRRALPGSGTPKALLVTPAPYEKTVHANASASGDYRALTRAGRLSVTQEGDAWVVELPPAHPWNVLLIQP